MLDEGLVLLDGHATLLLREASRPALLRLPELPLHRGEEAGQATLGHEVVSPGPHRGDRLLLVDRARRDDERQIEAAFLVELEGAGGPEAGHHEIREDQIPGLLVERSGHRLAAIDPFPGDVVPAATELMEDEQGVVLRVLDHQDAKRNSHLAPPGRTRHLVAGGMRASKRSRGACRGGLFLPDRPGLPRCRKT